jgi:hypothetical protein
MNVGLRINKMDGTLHVCVCVCVCVCADFEICVLEPDVKSKNRSGLSDEKNPSSSTTCISKSLFLS